MADFSDQVALVTGASRGIGRKVSTDLAAAGCTVVLASRSAKELKSLAEEIEGFGGRALAVEMDVGRADQVSRALEEVWAHTERVDILVNNAGITRDNLFMRMKEEEWRQVMEINLDGLFHVTRGVVTRMVRARYGRVINITSVVGQSGNAGQVNYASSKAGAIGFTKALAREVASRNVTVNAIAPGFIETDMTAGLKSEVRETLLKNIPVQRLGNVEDISSGVLFLASRQAGYITGHVLNINGGMYM